MLASPHRTRGWPHRARGWQVALLGLLVLAATVTGCTGQTVSVPAESGTVTLDTGEVLRLEFGHHNPSIGDDWVLVRPPDQRVLTDLGDDLDTGWRPAEGKGGELTWRFEATEAGSTALRFRYCNRNGPTDCSDGNRTGPTAFRLRVDVR